MTPFTLLASENPLEHVVDHALWAPGGWYVLTNHMLMVVAAAVIMLLVFPWATKRYRAAGPVPTGAHNLIEAIMLYIRNDVAKPVLGDEADRFMPFLWTLFFFILTCNLLGLLPLDALQHGVGIHHAVYGTATANIWITGTLAAFSFVLWNVSGVRANGIGNWAKHFLGGAPVFMAPIMILVEGLGMIVKPAALAIRLMANMIAGHVLVAVLIGFTVTGFGIGAAVGTGISVAVVLGTTAIMMLELFVAFLQAYIFTFLTSLFIGQLVIHEHEHHTDEGGHHDEAHETFGSGDFTDYDQLPEAAREAGTHMAG